MLFRFVGSLALMTVLGVSEVPLVAGGSLPTREEVLEGVFPGASFVAERLFLTAAQLEKVEELAGTEISSALWARYLIERDGVLVGSAYVDTHVVRTKKQSLLFCLDAEGRIKRIEATAFLEPPEYQASEAWLRQFEQERLDEELRLQRAIQPLTGATLTAAAVSRAARRILAIDSIVGLERDGNP